MSLDRLTFVVPGLFDFCAACPRPDEDGPLYLAVDGNFSFFRFKNAGGSNHTRTLPDSFFIDAVQKR